MSQDTPGTQEALAGTQLDLGICVKAAVSILADSYQSCWDLIEMGRDSEYKVVSSVYSLPLRSLSNHLAFFKKEMFEAMTEGYFPLRDAGKFNEQALAQYIKSEVDKLRAKVSFFKDRVPENELKVGLGVHFPLHDSLSKLTVDLVLKYFDLNYLMRQK